jgi:hypothetical protein
MHPVRTLAALVSLLAACGTAFNAQTGGDGGRGDAVDVQLGVLVWDRVDAEAGDHTDWKRLELEAPAKVRVRAWTFEPASFRGRLQVRDARGQLVETLPLTERLQELGPATLAEGPWFFLVEATEGAVDYGLEVTVEAADPAARRAPALD